VSVEAEAAQAALTSSTLRFAVLGNCQVGHVTRCLQAMVGGEWPTNEWINFEVLCEMADGRRDLTAYFERHDKVFMQPWIWKGIEGRYGHMKHKVVLYPCVEFLAYHPDLVYIHDAVERGHFAGPGGHYNSAIALLAWKAGLSVADALRLYRRDIFRRLGYFDFWESSCADLRAEGEAAGVPLGPMLERWIERGCFMHSVNHPKLFVMADVIAHLLGQLGIPAVPGNPIQYVRDYLADSIVWPVYPELGESLGVPGDYVFKLSSPGIQPDCPVRVLGLEEFVALSYLAFSRREPHELVCNRLDLVPYRQLTEELASPDSAGRLLGFQAPAGFAARDSATAGVAEQSLDPADRSRIDEARILFSPESVFWRQPA
jgi:hypothetical protein